MMLNIIASYKYYHIWDQLCKNSPFWNLKFSRVPRVLKLCCEWGGGGEADHNFVCFTVPKFLCAELQFCLTAPKMWSAIQFCLNVENFVRWSTILSHSAENVVRWKTILSQSRKFCGMIYNFVSQSRKFCGQNYNFVSQCRKMCKVNYNFVSQSRKFCGKNYNFVSQCRQFCEVKYNFVSVSNISWSQ